MSASSKSATIPQVGQNVQYRGSDDRPFAAVITMTAAEFDAEKAGNGMSVLAADEVSLTVFRVSGSCYARMCVPEFGSESYKVLVAKHDAYLADKAAAEADPDFDGELARVTVRSWSPLA